MKTLITTLIFLFITFSIYAQAYPPTLLSPANGATGLPLEIKLTWENNPSSPPLSDTIITIKKNDLPYLEQNHVSVREFNLSNLEYNTVYSWQVTNFFYISSGAHISEVFSFTTMLEPATLITDKTTVDFPELLEGDSPTPIEISLTKIGDQKLTISQIVINDISPANHELFGYSIIPDIPYEIEINTDTVTISVNFSTTLRGSFESEMIINHDGTNSPTSIEISGKIIGFPEVESLTAEAITWNQYKLSWLPPSEEHRAGVFSRYSIYKWDYIEDKYVFVTDTHDLEYEIPIVFEHDLDYTYAVVAVYTYASGGRISNVAEVTITAFEPAPNPAHTPTPIDGAINIPRVVINGIDNSVALSWEIDDTSGGIPTNYDVYIGKDEPEHLGRNTVWQVWWARNLEPNQKYYWKIVPINSSGVKAENAEIWSFTTMPLPPLAASDPDPEHEDDKVDIKTQEYLLWESDDAESWTLYFKEESELDFTIIEDLLEPKWLIEPELEYETTYIWRVDSENIAGVTTGDEWKFTTDAAPPIFVIEPTTGLDFENTVVGEVSTLEFEITNEGVKDLEIEITIEAENFSLDIDYLLLEANESETITITFEPITRGEFEATIVFEHNADNLDNPYEITVSGKSIAPVFTLNPVEYKPEITLVGRQTEPQYFTIKNTGDHDLDLDFNGTNDAEFVIGFDISQPWIIEPEGTFEFSIVFKPLAIGEREGILSFVHNAEPTEFDELELKGIGEEVTFYLAKEITIEPNIVNKYEDWNKYILSWESPDAGYATLQQYDIYQVTVHDDNWEFLDNVLDPAPKHELEITDLLHGIEYLFVVQAVYIDSSGDIWGVSNALSDIIMPEMPLPYFAQNPDPKDEAIDISINPVLKWTANSIGMTPTEYDIYFGTDKDDFTDIRTVLADNLTFTTDLLEYETEYFWKIVPKNEAGEAIDTPIWSFTTMPSPPLQAINPDPEDGDDEVNIKTQKTLSWEFDDNGSEPESWTLNFRSENQLEDTIIPITGEPEWTINPPLEYATTYFWRVDSTNIAGTTEGEDWSFTTELSPPIFVIDEDNHQFDDTRVGENSAIKTFTITNTGARDLLIEPLSISGDGEHFNYYFDKFTITKDEPVNLYVEFTPTARGEFSAKIEFSHNAENERNEIDLQGKGIAPVFDVFPKTYDPKTMLVGRETEAQDFVITNNGDYDLDINITITGDNSGDFILYHQEPPAWLIEPTKSLEFSISFKPSSEGERTATLTFVHNAELTEFDTIELTGYGEEITFYPAKDITIVPNIENIYEDWNKYILSWKEPDTGYATLQQYDIYQVTVHDGEWHHLTSISDLDQQHWLGITDLSHGIDYYFVVQAVYIEPNGVSDAQSTIITPDMPLPYHAQNSEPKDGAEKISINPVLKWTANSTGMTPTGYNIYFGTDKDDWTFTNSTPANNPTFTTGTLEYETEYFWKIEPLNEKGVAINLPIWSFTTVPAPPLPVIIKPLDFTETVTGIELIISWSFDDKGSEPLNYGVKFGKADESTWIWDYTETEWSPADLLDYDTEYEYQISAHNEGGVQWGELQTFRTALYPPHIDVSVTELDFGQIRLGTSDELTFYIENIGVRDLIIEKIEFTAPTDFEVYFNNAPIVSDSSIEITVKFSPSELGKIETEMLIISNSIGYETPYSVTVEGYGIGSYISIDPMSKDFGEIYLGISSENEEFTITNYGNQTLIISEIEIIGENISAFEIIDLVLPIQVISEVDILVRFTPEFEGLHEAYLKFEHDGYNVMENIKLTGSGKQPIPQPPTVLPIQEIDTDQWNSILLKWEKSDLYYSGELTGYQIFLSNNGRNDDVLIDELGPEETQYLVLNLDEGFEYNFYIIALFTNPVSVSDKVFFEKFIAIEPAPGCVTMLLPFNDDVKIVLETTLSWEASTENGVTTTGYEIYFSEDNPPLLANGNYSGTIWSPGILEHGKQYFWKIVPFNAKLDKAEDCEIWSFVTIPPMPNPVVPIYPTHEQPNVQIEDLYLIWEPGEEAEHGELPTGYHVFFGTDNPPLENISWAQTETSFPIEVEYDTIYYWAIVPFNTTDTNTNVPIWSFRTIEAPPEINVTPLSHNFGEIRIGNSSEPIDFTIENEGVRPLIINIDILDRFGFEFSGISDEITIPGGLNHTITVLFSPLSQGLYQTNITISHNVDNNVDENPYTIAISGTGVEPVFEIDPISHDFGGILQGTLSDPQTFTINNENGNTDLIIETIRIEGVDWEHFELHADAQAWTISPKQSKSFRVIFSPKTEGAKSVDLTITHNADESVTIVKLTGSGEAAIYTKPTNLRYIEIQWDTYELYWDAPIDYVHTEHTGYRIYRSINSSDNWEFIDETTNPYYTVAELTSKDIYYYAVTALYLDNNESDKAYFTFLTPVEPAKIEISHININFGEVVIGDEITERIAIENIGGRDLLISDIFFNSPYGFYMQHDDDILLETNDIAFIDITFKPIITGVYFTDLVIEHNADTSPNSIYITGTGVAPIIHIEPSTLDFGNVYVTQKSEPDYFVIKNIGTSNLIITNIEEISDYIVKFANEPIIPGGDITIEVIFEPLSSGNKNKYLNIYHNAADSPSTIDLIGTAYDIYFNPPIVESITAEPYWNNAKLKWQAPEPGSAGTLTHYEIYRSLLEDSEFYSVKITENTDIYEWTDSNLEKNITYYYAIKAVYTQFDESSSLVYFPPITPIEPAIIEISHSSYDFDKVELGDEATVEITIQNIGGRDLTINNIYFSSPTGFDKSHAELDIILKSYKETSIEITFKPNFTGKFYTDLVIEHNADTSPDSIYIIGTGVAPIIHIEPSTLDFGNIYVNYSSDPLFFTIKNNGTSDLIITNIEEISDYIVKIDNKPIVPGDDITIEVIFEPLSSGNKNRSLNIYHNAAGSPSTIELIGSAFDVFFNPPIIESITAEPYWNNAKLRWQAPEPGSAGTLTEYEIYKSLYYDKEYELIKTIDNVDISEWTDSNLDKNITYYYAIIAVYSNFDQTSIAAYFEPITPIEPVPNRATYLEPIEYADNVSLTPILKWDVPITPDKGVPTGYKVYINDELQTGVNDSKEFEITQPLDYYTIYTWTIIPFNDTGDAEDNITWMFKTIQPDPAEIEISPSIVTFDDTRVGYSSEEQIIEISNIGGTDLIVEEITLLDTENFILSDITDAVIEPNSHISLSVVFTPTRIGNISSSIKLSIDTEIYPIYITLNGTGLMPIFEIDKTEIDFGELLIHDTTEPEIITIYNTGNEILIIEDIYLVNQQFNLLLDDELPWNIPPISGRKEFAVSFTPTVEGLIETQLHIIHNAKNSPATINMFGVADVLSFNPPQSLDVYSYNTWDSVVLFWTVPEPVKYGYLNSYGIYRRLADSDVWELQHETPNAETLSWIDYGLLSHHEYFYTVTAVYTSPSGESIPSNVVSITPIEPVPNHAIIISPENNSLNNSINIELKWEADITGSVITGYDIYFGKEFPLSHVSNQYENSYLLNDLDYNQVYYWQIVPYNATGEAENCPIWKFTTIESMPLAAINPTPADESYDISLFTKLMWNYDDLGSIPTGYKVYFGTENSLILLDNIENTVFDPLNHVTLQYNTTYFWKIVPFNNTGDALDCPIWSFTTEVSPAEIHLSTDSISFLDTRVGLDSEIQTFYIHNLGEKPLEIGYISLEDSNNEFVIYHEAPLTIEHNSNIPVSVVFNPKKQGNITKLLYIKDFEQNILATVTLSGCGIEPVFEIDMHDFYFGELLYNTSSEPQPFNINNNNGNTTLTVTNMWISGANNSDFILLAEGRPWNIEPGNDKSFSVIFNPKTAGYKEADLIILHNGDEARTTVKLSGIAEAPIYAEPENLRRFQANESDWDIFDFYWDAPVDYLHTELLGYRIYLKNNMTDNWDMITYTNDTFYKATDLISKVTYLYAVTALYSNENESDKAYFEAITPIEPAIIDISPISHDFGNILIGEDDSVEITVKNIGGMDLVINEFYFTAPDGFSILHGDLPITLETDETTIIMISFIPLFDVDYYTDLFVCSTLDEQLNAFISFTGKGIKPIIFIEPDELDFGNIYVDYSSEPQFIKIKNIGSSDLIINDIDEISDYIVNFDNLPIVPGDEIEIEIIFEPLSSGNKDKSLIIYHNADNSPSTIYLKGRAYDIYFNPPIAISIDAEPFWNNATLKWQEPELGSAGTLTHYEIYKNDTKITDTENPNIYEWTDSNLDKNITYLYYIVAVYDQLDGCSIPAYFDPITPIEPVPNKAIYLEPINEAVDISLTPTLIWDVDFTPDKGLPTGYKVYINDVLQTDNHESLEYEITTMLEYDTIYTWKIIPFNETGDAEDNIEWTFTTILPPVPLHAINPIPENNDNLISKTPLLSWEPNPEGTNPTGYNIYFGTENPPTIVPSFDPNDTSWSPSSELQYNTIYYWQVVPFNNTGDAIDCPIWSFTTIPVEPLQNLDAVVAGQSVVLTFTEPTDLSYTSIIIERAVDDGDFYFLDELTSGTMYIDNSVEVDCKYMYRIAVIYSLPFEISEFTDSNAVIIPIYNPPRDLVAVSGLDTIVELIWNPPLTQKYGTLIGYNLYRDNALLDFTVSEFYTDTFLQNATNYTYYVEAKWGGEINGISQPSNLVEATPEDYILTPTNLSAQIINTYNVRLTWELSSLPPSLRDAPSSPPSMRGAGGSYSRAHHGFLIYRDNELLTPTPITETMYIDTGRALDTKHTYQVISVYDSGNSQPCSIDVIVPRFNAVTNLQANNYTQQINLSWNQPETQVYGTVIGYEVSRNGVLLQTITNNIYVDSNISIDNSYIYNVVVVWGGDISGKSLPVLSDPILIPGFNPPRNLTAVSGLDSVVNLAWEFALPQTYGTLLGYNLYRDGVKLNVNSPLLNTTYMDTNLHNSRDYSYYVTAVWGGIIDGESIASNTVIGTPEDALIPPSYIYVEIVGCDIVISWLHGTSQNRSTTNNRAFLRYSIHRNDVFLVETNEPYFTDISPQTDTEYTYSVRAIYDSGASEPISSSVILPKYGAVSDLNGLHQDNEVIVSWIAPQVQSFGDVYSYKVYRNGILIDNIANTNYLDSDPIKDWFNTYEVVAIWGGLISGESVPTEVSVFVPIYNPISNLNLQLNDDNVIISWDSPTQQLYGTVDCYHIFRDGIELGTTKLTSFLDKPVIQDKLYTYAVIAMYINPSGEAIAVQDTIIYPAFYAPKELIATSANGRIELNWTAPDSVTYGNHIGYNLYRNNNMYLFVYDNYYIDNDVIINEEYSYYVTAAYGNPNGESLPTNSVILVVKGTSTDDDYAIPINTELIGNYPNPFNPETTITFALANAGYVSIHIYNVRGQKIVTLFEGFKDAGLHSINWKSEQHSSGIYLYMMKTDDYTNTKKMMLMK